MLQLEAFAAAMGVCDPTLEAHARRVAGYADAIARRLCWEERELEGIPLGAALHDVGKLSVRADVLAKPGPLDRAERAEIEAHPVEGAWLISTVRSFAGALPYVLFHHERWDGHGYPTRRAGRAIPIEGRVLAVADAFDAMTSPRPYRDALSAKDAAAEVEQCAGTQFDPEVASAFLDALVTGEVGDVVVAGAASP
ncbi:MAG: HD domain-containing protein [Thermoleophilia bacterium]|nr:HD domain-containing protein [Thermoleophilia bacterium]MDH5334365.1 HD domain-containing protein [Thermoleophilia bacterium]